MSLIIEDPLPMDTFVEDFTDHEIGEILDLLSFTRVAFFTNKEEEVRIFDPENAAEVDALIENLFGDMEGIVSSMVPSRIEACPVFRFVMLKQSGNTAINFKLQHFLCQAGIRGIGARSDPVLVIGYTSMRHNAEMCDVPYNLYTHIALDDLRTTEIDLKNLHKLQEPVPHHCLRFTCSGCSTRKSKCTKHYPCSTCTRRGVSCTPAKSEGSVLRRSIYAMIFSCKLAHNDMAKIQMHFQLPRGKFALGPYDLLSIQTRLGMFTTSVGSENMHVPMTTYPQIDQFIGTSMCYKIEWMTRGHYRTRASSLYNASIFDGEHVMAEAQSVGVPVVLMDTRGCTDATVSYLLWIESITHPEKIIVYHGYLKRVDGVIEAAAIRMYSVVTDAYTFTTATTITPS